MPRNRLSAVLSALLFIPISVIAQSPTLDMKEVLRLVLERNAAVQIADALERQAEALHRV